MPRYESPYDPSSMPRNLEHVIYEKKGHIAYVTLNRPAVGNQGWVGILTRCVPSINARTSATMSLPTSSRKCRHDATVEGVREGV